MTLVVSWIRREGNTEELLVASDSRISGGTSLDQAPKILRLVRDDAVLAFCGITRLAYPIIIQIKLALDAYEPTRKRLIDIVELPVHLNKIIESIRKNVADLPDKSDEPIAFKIMLAGFSWRTGGFKSWVLRFDLRNGGFTAHPIRPHRINGRTVFAQFMSDQVVNERRARIFLDRALREDPDSKWAPFEALLDQIEDVALDDVGGAPQLVKIYRHANTLPINTIWPFAEISPDGFLTNYHITHFGRALLPYERTDFLSLDCGTRRFIEPWKVQEYVKNLNTVQRREVLTRQRNAAIAAVANSVAAISNRKIKQKLATVMISNGHSCSEIVDAISKL